ncbi:MAG: hypothetical protein ACK6AD_14955 [Cyanobacteriota bacterium]|jgi:hypothetical protein
MGGPAQAIPASQASPGTFINVLPDISGMAWMRDDLFVVVHDSKNRSGKDRPRLSLLRLPSSPKGFLVRHVDLPWPGPQGLANDLESVARIPDTQDVLLVESGDDGSGFRRLFHARLSDQGLKLINVGEWPRPITNVEGTAVARVGNRLVFLYAERAWGQASTSIHWADLQLQTLKLGDVQQVTFTSPGPGGSKSRPVTSLEVDRHGVIVVSSAVDPDNDLGPFRSMVWRIGRVTLEEKGQPVVVLDSRPELRAILDGWKVEALSLRERPGASPVLYIGTDDEFYGGTIRPLPEAR